MATTLDYIHVPHCATRLSNARPRDISTSDSLKCEPKFTTKLPPDSSSQPVLHSLLRNTARPTSPTSMSLSNNAANLLPQMLLSSTISIDPVLAAQTRKNSVTLLSNKDSLSIPTTTSNFKRFVTIVGPVFWIQDRIEEILLWKKGSKVTITWMGIYTFLCIYPRLLFMVPLAILLGFMLSTNPVIHSSRVSPPRSNSIAPEPSPLLSAQSSPKTESTEKSKEKDPVTFGDYQRNVQGIQNLMGFVAEMNDSCAPCLPLVTYSSSHSAPYSIFLTVLLLFIGSATLLVTHTLFPARFVALFVGIGPWIASHPDIHENITSTTLLHLASSALSSMKAATSNPHATYIVRKMSALIPYFFGGNQSLPSTLELFATQCISQLTKFLDNDHLDDKCWASELEQVELFENERFSVNELDAKAGPVWSKSNLLPVERGPWTRGRDGWSSVGDTQGHVSNLTFSLSPGWSFVETEDWRKDLTGDWVDGVVDSDGWCYTTDIWSNTSSSPTLECVTRRRRWIRRVWFDSGRADT